MDVCNIHIGTFDLEMSRSLGVILCTFPKKGGTTRKQLIVEQNMKIWASGVYVVCILVFLTLNMSGSWDDSVHFFGKWDITQKLFILDSNQ